MSSPNFFVGPGAMQTPRTTEGTMDMPASSRDLDFVGLSAPKPSVTLGASPEATGIRLRLR